MSRIDSGARLEYGLHATGREQARAAGDAFKAIVQTRPVTILSSDFSRTFETAKLVAATVNADVEAEPALRERDFGDFELGPNTAYEAVWEQDAIDAKHTAWGVEAPPCFGRAAGAVRAWNAREGHAVLLVSHGDRRDPRAAAGVRGGRASWCHPGSDTAAGSGFGVLMLQRSLRAARTVTYAYRGCPFFNANPRRAAPGRPDPPDRCLAEQQVRGAKEGRGSLKGLAR